MNLGILVKNKLRLNWRKILNSDKSERKNFLLETWKKKNPITFRMKLVKLVEKFMYTDAKRWNSLKEYVLSLVFMCRTVFIGNFWAYFIALGPVKRTECPVLESCVGIQSDKL